MKKTWFVSLALAGWASLSVVRATVITEDFSTDPLANGWQMFGNTNLFHWNPTNQNLEVTWDSSQPNSYFYHSLGTILAKDNSFSITFDLEIVSLDPNSGGMEVAIGFFNLNDAVNLNWERAVGENDPPYSPLNLVEFDYFPVGANYADANPYFPTVFPALVDTNAYFNYCGCGDLSFYELVTTNWYHVIMTYTAANQLLLTTVTNRAQNAGTSTTEYLNGYFTDFRVDTISVSSYSAAGDLYGDFIYAQGIVSNIIVTLPQPPIQNLTGGFNNAIWQTQFLSQSNWLYALQRTEDFQSWTNVLPVTAGNMTNLFLQDTNPPAGKAFYRVSAQRP